MSKTLAMILIIGANLFLGYITMGLWFVLLIEKAIFNIWKENY